MKMNKFIILPLFFLSIIFSLSASSWVMIWMGMELNLLSFIFMLLKEKTIMNTESTMSYFMIQAIGSLMFLFVINVNMIFYNEISSINAWAPPLALMLKSGMAPLHSWTPSVVSKFNPSSLFMFLTMQKLVPMVILFSSWFSICTWISFTNIFMGSIGGITQASVHKLLVSSSINNIGWMILCMMQSILMFVIFFFSYTMMNFLTINFVKTFKIKWVVQINSMTYTNKLLFFSLMMSLGGLPPFLGFMPKWLIIKKISSLMPTLVFFSIILSVITLFFYMKMTLTLLVLSSSDLKSRMTWKTSLKYYLFVLFNCLSPLMFVVLT
uniref:NADH-ubiquinone oxidoreductase chain 2 n=1 Tax=Paratrioza sinica TaxID=1511640 RepID=A0A068ETY1_9HEMI|nr:NADH dehydrogenase subunit 2 [Paratrioza sinica]AID54939.1 NADH dehydrogenase subunit 2 [Paratrioza sinica]